MYIPQLLILLSILITYICFVIISPTRPNILLFWISVAIDFGLCYLLLPYFEYILPLLCAATLVIMISIKNKNIILNLFNAILACMITLIADFMFASILILITGVEISELLYANGMEKVCIYAVGTGVVAIILSLIISYVLNKKVMVEEIAFKGKNAVLLIVLMLSGAFFFFAMTDIGRKSGLNNNIISAMGIVIAFYFVCTFAIMFQVIRNTTTEAEINNQKLQNANLESYVKELERVYTEMQAFRHDYKNILASLYMFIIAEDMKGLKIYFEEDIMKMEAINDNMALKINYLNNLNNGELSGVITAKALSARETGVDFEVDIPEKIENIPVDNIDLVRMVGILLDNAIEENINVDNGYVRMGIIKDEEYIVIRIVNSTKNEIEDLDMLFNSGYSTKAGNMGIGLITFKNIVNKYENLKYMIETEKNELSVELEII